MTFWCVGRNYSEHAKELGNTIPDRPLIFSKSRGTLQKNSELVIDPHVQSFHHELEIVLLLNKDLEISHWTLGLDFTDRTTQNELKSKGEPWELCKSFKGSTALGPWQKLANLDDLNSFQFQLEVNDQIRQRGHVKDMIFPPLILLSYLKKHFPMEAGDAVFTGTPAGVAALKSGDRVKAQSGELTVLWTLR
jgi:2-keto-4-pentenoate hydratase/2-oxohepta-3-ene-1,7-dioic acid hydratase in catechol pathway